MSLYFLEETPRGSVIFGRTIFRLNWGFKNSTSTASSSNAVLYSILRRPFLNSTWHKSDKSGSLTFFDCLDRCPSSKQKKSSHCITTGLIFLMLFCKHPQNHQKCKCFCVSSFLLQYCHAGCPLS